MELFITGTEKNNGFLNLFHTLKMTIGCADKVKITGLLIKSTALAVTPCDPSIFPNCACVSETHNNFPYPTKTPRLSQQNLNQKRKDVVLVANLQ